MSFKGMKKVEKNIFSLTVIPSGMIAAGKMVPREMDLPKCVTAATAATTTAATAATAATTTVTRKSMTVTTIEEASAAKWVATRGDRKLTAATTDRVSSFACDGAATRPLTFLPTAHHFHYRNNPSV